MLLIFELYGYYVTVKAIYEEAPPKSIVLMMALFKRYLTVNHK